MVFSNRIVFSMTVVAFLASDILKNGSGPIFHMNLYAFLKQICFFNESVCFFGFGYFGRRFCSLFSYEFIGFFQAELFFQGECLVFWRPAFCKTVLRPFFHLNSEVFVEQNCFFNDSVFSFGFRHFVRRFCGIFII